MMDEIPAIMTVEQVAKYLSFHPLTVRRLARDGEIPALKIGSQWRVRKELLDQWIVEQSEMNVAGASEAEE